MQPALIEQLSDPSLLKQASYIAGQWRSSLNAQRFEVHNPASGDAIASVENACAEQTRQAVDAAEQAMPAWRALSAKARCEVLERWCELVLANTEDLTRILTAEQGKPLAEARGEINYAASYIKWFAEEGKRVYGDLISGQVDRRSVVLKQPIGIVAAITPWNFPCAMITRKVAPALAVGCAVVLKPAELTPLSALALAELAARAGLPDGLFNVVAGTDAAAIGGVLTSDTRVKKMTFTGSTPVGKLLMSQCAATVKRSSMELGGNAPIIVFEDADIDLAVAGTLAAKFRNSGQTCICANRLLVHSAVHDEFVAKLQSAIANFHLGDGFAEQTTHGPLITAEALNNVGGKVDRAVAQGAVLACGGEVLARQGHFYTPTILTGVTPKMDIFDEEIFGPVAPVIAFESEEEAVRMANDTQFGLAAYFYTRDMARTWRVGEALEYGMVGINETAISAENIPFGGVKESGQGREGSKYGLDDYLETKYMCIGNIA
ncbi:MAG: NAD-dependent succinate-semialdehyde dehydrogenase [Pseudomonadales bacterium]